MQTDEQIKEFIQIIGFTPKANTSNIFYKQYPNHSNYEIDIDFSKKIITYGSQIRTENKSSQNFTQEENWVVLECVDRLLIKGYKPQNIILEKTWAAGHGTSGRLDVCITRIEDDTEYLLIECKVHGKEFDTALKKLNNNGGQLFTYFKFSNKADVLMLYSSKLDNASIVYDNAIVNIEDDYRNGDAKDFYDKWNKLTSENGIFEKWATPYSFKSKSLTISMLQDIKQEDSSFIFNRFLEILRHNVVSDKPNAFNKIFTLFLCKIYDEKNNEGTDNDLDFQWRYGIDDDESFQLRLTDLYREGMKEFLDKNVTDFTNDDFDTKYISLDDETKESLKRTFNKIRLEKNNEFAIKEVYDHKSFIENAKVVKEVVELLQRYKIRYTKKQQYLSDFFELLLTTGLKQESGQFFTPVPIAQFIIKSLPIDKIVSTKISSHRKDDLLPYIIDYAAGSGHFLTESMHIIQKLINGINTGNLHGEAKKFVETAKLNHFDWALQYIYGIEKDYRLVKVGKVGCYLHGDGLANVVHSDGLSTFNNETFKGKLQATDEDFPKENKQFDILVSNPPYSVSAFKGASREYYTEKDFDLYKHLTDNSSEIESLFVERTKQLLKDGGVAGIILPSSIFSNSGIYEKCREIILQYFEIIAITILGSNTFMATDTNTVVLFMRRRNNYDSSNAKKLLEQFFQNRIDVTINRIETPVKKYIDHVWKSISFDDYVSLIKNTPNDNIKKHEIFMEFEGKLKTKTNNEFLKKVLEIEFEKIFYFILAYPQKVVLVRSGEKDAEKRFIGYEFSNRRGSEGIHPIQRGKTIEECTQLFDVDSFANLKKASTYIYKAFNGDFDTPIDESMSNNISRVKLIDLMDFERFDFDISISTNVKKKITYQYKTIQLDQITNIEKGSSRITKERAITGSIPVVAAGKNIAYYHNISNRTSKVITISASGANAGYINYYGIPIFASDCNTIQSKDENIARTKYIYVYLSNIQEYIYLLQRGQAQPHVYSKDLKKIKIPLPPLDIQYQIVAEIETLENVEKECINKISVLQSTLLKSEYFSFSAVRIGNIATMVKRGKTAKYGNSEIQIIKSGQARGYLEFEFSQKHYVDAGFVSDDRNLQKGDVLINSTGVGTAGRVTMFNLDGAFVVDSHITIVRLNQELAEPKYVLYALANIGFKNIEAMANGQSGQIELSLDTIKHIKIPLPSLREQRVIVAKIEQNETEITNLQLKISELKTRKRDILNKYL